ncbi:oxidoreductase [Arthrobacter crystallopoietes BAB-32]|uniref:Oxidoreductase n=1 Tax=Arthrobacter crystallopoietes BAB-32 TaxID=1246476 RepID=N1V061_9MICC|nr:flavin reductase family protein [Arthrobacter crystallopoietes]EMY34690.1 oxidoreductase [Arthrobacter crystallopoietes BAB-32]
MGIDDDIDRLVSGLDYPMLIVTAASEQAGRVSRSGCLVGFATQCSISPARFLVCISKNNHTHRVAREAAVLAIHLPAADQRGLASLFGEHTGDEVDKFAECEWTDGPGGVPLLTDCPRRMVAKVLDRFDLGDHTGFLVAPVDATVSSDAAVLLSSHVADFDAGHSA